MPYTTDQNDRHNGKRRKSQSDISHKIACDRCRGQKLRCVWERNSQKCHRCTRAKAICSLSPPRPMGRPQRQTGASQRDSEESFGGEDESEPNYEAYVSGSMYPSLQYEGDALMDFPTSDEIFSLNNSDTDAAEYTQTNTSLLTNLSLENDGDSSSPSPLLEMLNHIPGGMFLSEQGSGGAMTNAIVPNMLESASLMCKTAAATTYNVTPDMANSLPMIPAIDKGSELRDDDLKQVTQLCNFTLALCEHPLYKASQAESLSKPTITGEKNPTSETISLADLGIGRLLSITAQLSTVMTQIRSMDPLRLINKTTAAEASSQKKILQARSTILLVLNCYSRLELVFLSTLDTLRDAQKSGKRLNDSHRLMPGLVVDGFPLGDSQDLQLRFAIQICEQNLETIHKITRETGGRAGSAIFGDIGDDPRTLDALIPASV